MATWSNGAALESFVGPRRTRDSPSPDGATLSREIERAFDEALVAEPQPDLVVTFNDEGSPWYTLCEIRGRDRVGLLHAVTVGFATAEVSVHSARIETRADVAFDRFELSMLDGQKLDDATKRATAAAIQNGVRADGPRRSRWRRTKSSVG